MEKTLTRFYRNLSKYLGITRKKNGNSVGYNWLVQVLFVLRTEEPIEVLDGF
jgi:hypothetical protein